MVYPYYNGPHYTRFLVVLDTPNSQEFDLINYFHFTPTTTVRIVIFGIFACLDLCFYGFAFVESIHRSDFCGGPEYPGFELCLLTL